MKIDYDKLSQIIANNYVPMVEKELGDRGTTALKQLLQLIRELFRTFDPERLDDRLTIFKQIESKEALVDRTDATQHLDLESLASQLHGPCVVELLDSGACLLWKSKTVDEPVIALKSVAYSYFQQSEYFFAGKGLAQVEKIAPTFSSSFAIPAFSELREALEFYSARMARYCSCQILVGAFENSRRLYLIARPERVMRRSLMQYLESTLRDVEVRPEQNVDETHPIDIKVTWLFARRIALIEIKWLGDSRTAGGGTIQYRDGRANEGVAQLVGYLEKNNPYSPTHACKGYLAVFDIRRRQIGADGVTIDPADAVYYRDREIAWNPPVPSRVDLDAPIRIFVEPNLGAQNA